VIQTRSLPRRLQAWRGRRLLALGLALVAVALLALIVHDVIAPPGSSGGGTRTTVIRRGTVSAAVSGTGTVVPVQQQNVAFRASGQLTEVDVKVGDQVHTGQVLARIDQTTYQTALQQAQASLAQAEANLSTAQNSNAVTQAQHQLAAAQQAYNDAVNQVALQNQQDANAVTNAQNQFNSDNCAGQPQPAGSKCYQDQQALNQAQNKQASDQLSGQHQINQARASVVSAQDAVNSAANSRPNTIAAAQASVDTAQAGLQTAQNNLNSTTLTSPIDGVISALNGQVGESVSASGGATAQAPGSTAPQPAGSGSSSSSSSTAGAAGTTGGSASSGSAFAVINNSSSMQVVAPLAEADAAKVKPDQTVSLSFDALPGVTLPGHVLAVAPGSSTIQNVTNYYVTLTLDTANPSLRSGMTANAAVVVSQATNVLAVPNSAISRSGGTNYVTLLQKDGKTQVRVAVETGVVGDTSTEVTAGVAEGDRVVLPSTRLPAGGGTTTGRGAGGGVRLGG